MLILRLFCENSPRIIDASGADPAVLKTGSMLLFANFYPIYTQILLNCRTPP